MANNMFFVQAMDETRSEVAFTWYGLCQHPAMRTFGGWLLICCAVAWSSIMHDYATASG